MKTSLRLIAASLFVGQFGSGLVTAEPPRVSAKGLFRRTSDESDAMIMLLDPRDTDGAILLLNNTDRAGQQAPHTTLPWTLHKARPLVLTTEARPAVKVITSLPTDYPADGKSHALFHHHVIPR